MTTAAIAAVIAILHIYSSWGTYSVIFEKVSRILPPVRLPAVTAPITVGSSLDLEPLPDCNCKPNPLTSSSPSGHASSLSKNTRWAGCVSFPRSSPQLARCWMKNMKPSLTIYSQPSPAPQASLKPYMPLAKPHLPDRADSLNTPTSSFALPPTAPDSHPTFRPHPTH